eukprot:4753332-Amphidinium_carterae.1
MERPKCLGACDISLNRVLVQMLTLAASETVFCESWQQCLHEDLMGAFNVFLGDRSDLALGHRFFDQVAAFIGVQPFPVDRSFARTTRSTSSACF